MVFKKLFGKRRSRSEDHENGHKVDMEGSLPSSQPAKQSEQIDQERRRVLQGILGIGGLAALAGTSEGCTVYEDYRTRFDNNFDFSQYDKFDQDDLRIANSRNSSKMKAKDCYQSFQKSMDQHLPFRIDLNDIFLFEDGDNEGLVTMTCQIRTPEAQQALLDRYPFMRSIMAHESPHFTDNFFIFTDRGYISFAANGSSVELHDYDRETGISMLYNTSGSDVQASPEDSDFQRTVFITGRDSQGKKFYHERTYETDGGMLDYRGLVAQTFSSDSFPQHNIRDTKSLIDFLRHARSTAVVNNFFKNVREQNDILREESGGHEPEPSKKLFSLHQIENIDQLLEIFKLLPADPQTYSMLLRGSLNYHDYDKTAKDEYRDPITTLRSAWADCDDFVVINYFWAYLHGFEPHITIISAGSDHHGVVWYRNERKDLVVLDNNDVFVLGPEYDIRRYLDEFCRIYAGRNYTIEYDGPA